MGSILSSNSPSSSGSCKCQSSKCNTNSPASSGSCNSSSPNCNNEKPSPSTGSLWTSNLYFTPDALNPGDTISVLSHDDLITHFKKVDGMGDSIKRLWIYKHNLSSWIPKWGSPWGGIWHEFTIIKSENWYWSFEKDAEGLSVQRSKGWKAVKERYRGKERTGSVAREKKISQSGRKGSKMLEIFQWIHDYDHLNKGYNVRGSNYQDFASAIFDEFVKKEEFKQMNTAV